MELNNLCISDLFDFLPDPIMLHIFNKVSDIQSLTRCRAVSKRFNSLAPQSDSLVLRVDRVTSDTDPNSDSDSKKIILTLLRPIIKCFNPFTSPKKKPIFVNPTRPHDSPARILHGFESIRSLKIELPAGDLKLEKDSTVKWAANFGMTLQSSVILGFRNGTQEGDFGGSGLKTRVAWTISSLISASARHYMMVDVVKEQPDLTHLVVNDKDGEGTLTMDKKGLEECRKKNDKNKDEDQLSINSGGLGILCKSKRTKVPAVRMRIRHMSTIELNNGDKLEGATLVVIRPAIIGGGSGGGRGGAKVEAEEYRNDVRLAMDAFGNVELYKNAVDKLLKSKSYVLEMNSF